MMENKSAFFECFLTTARDIFRQSTIHGLKYVYQPKHSRLQQLANRIIWIGSSFLGASVLVIMFNLIRIRYATTPTIITVETTNHPIWNVQFPAVTLCNINKVYEPATENIRERLYEKGLSERTIQSFLSRMASLVSPSKIDSSYLQTYKYLEEMNYTTQMLMLELMQPCENMILHCLWLGTEYPCLQMFRVTMTPEGFCCSFNNKAIKADLEINNHKKLVSKQLNSPVYHVYGYGEYVGLTVLLDAETEWYVSPSNSFYGISVLIHDPDEFPEKSVNIDNVQPGESVSVAMIPTVIVSQPEVRLLPPNQRDCLFPNEMPLRTSDKYTYKTCLIECVVDTILKLCGCIPFYYPHLQLHPYSVDSRQCTLHDVNCLAEHSSVFASIQPPISINGYNDSILEGMQCSCRHSCSEQTINVETVTAVRDPKGVLTISEQAIPQRVRDNTTDFKQLSTLSIYFKEIACIKYSRDLFMSWDAVIANLGGLFGLCLGGSIISLIEIVYYFTLPMIYRFTVLLGSRSKVIPMTRNQCKNRNDMAQYGYMN